MNNILPAEAEHLSAFVQARPEWPVCLLHERIADENDGGREHKYARAHPYVTGMQYVLQYVRDHAPCKMLDIGSPLAQNAALACLPGVEITVLDVRPHPDADSLHLNWKLGNATELPFPDASWGFVVSLWVMGHVGDGRYGDAFDINGDRRMLAEIARVLAPGGYAIFGPGLIDTACANIFNLHRIYSWPWLHAEFERVGLEVIDQRDLHVSNDVFVTQSRDSIERRDGVYGLALLKKR